MSSKYFVVIAEYLYFKRFILNHVGHYIKTNLYVWVKCMGLIGSKSTALIGVIPRSILSGTSWFWSKIILSIRASHLRFGDPKKNIIIKASSYYWIMPICFFGYFGTLMLNFPFEIMRPKFKIINNILSIRF